MGLGAIAGGDGLGSGLEWRVRSGEGSGWEVRWGWVVGGVWWVVRDGLKLW